MNLQDSQPVAEAGNVVSAVLRELKKDPQRKFVQAALSLVEELLDCGAMNVVKGNLDSLLALTASEKVHPA